VDLIDKEDGAGLLKNCCFFAFSIVSTILNPACTALAGKWPVQLSGDDPGERGFQPRRSQYKRGYVATFNAGPEYRFFTYKMLLTHIFIQVLWPHPVGERLIGANHICCDSLVKLPLSFIIAVKNTVETRSVNFFITIFIEHYACQL
jgi:hypothetical protein